MLSKSINVLQLIDSLSVGGAERVSINYANAISEQVGFKSFLCATREEGLLKDFILSDVNYFFMNKKSNKDINSYKNLIKYVKENNIDIIHAHSSSFFTACIIKFFTGVKVVWHDHLGNRYNYSKSNNNVIKLFSTMFSYVICVNTKLKKWSYSNLFVKRDKIDYIENYPDLIFSESDINLPGKNKKRIVLLANLRVEKNHFLAIKAFYKFLNENDEDKDWSLLFVGRDFEDEYSNQVKNLINEYKLYENIFVLGARTDTADILKSCDIGILSSDFEGLPVALLEYGLAKLAVISTDVGQCKEVLSNGEVGIICEKNNIEEFSNAISKLIKDKSFRKDIAIKYNDFVEKNYSKKAIVHKVINIYKEIVNV